MLGITATKLLERTTDAAVGARLACARNRGAGGTNPEGVRAFGIHFPRALARRPFLAGRVSFFKAAKVRVRGRIDTPGSA